MPRPPSHSHPSRRSNNKARSTSRSTTSSCGSLYTWLLSLLATFLLGTVIVLSIVKSFFGVDWNDALNAEEVNYYSSLPTLPYGSSPPPSSSSGNNSPPSVTIEKIPRIIHQTWKTTLLPTKWAKLTSQCKSLHPDYEYKLWTDESSIEFIREHYNWFLPTFMNYKLDIQRADVIRYFVLHKYGGVYMDLDIGCRRAMDPLLNFQTILPATKPVGISNDLIFSEPNSPFMDSVIHNLIAFDHYYLSDYPTVMFSTGPMFLSAVLSLWNSRSTYADVSSAPLVNRGDITARSPFYFAVSSNNHHNNQSDSLLSSLTRSVEEVAPPNPFGSQDNDDDQQHVDFPVHTVRILPRELYGKNIEAEKVPDSFFYHYYGSSWHKKDSFIFTFLGQFGKILMNFAFFIVLSGTAFIVIRRIRKGSSSNSNSSSSFGRGLIVGIMDNNNNSSGSNAANRGYSRLSALDYDSDIEEGNGRCTPPLSLPLPSSSSSAPTSRSSNCRRSKRRQYRRVMAAGARHWLFGGGRMGNSLISNLTGGSSSVGNGGGGRRRSASTGAISLPVNSSESGSEDAVFYTSSSEDGRETRRGSFFGRDNAAADHHHHHQHQRLSASQESQYQYTRRASIWTEDDDIQYRRHVLDPTDGQVTVAVSSIARTSPPLHRRPSSQPGNLSRSNTPSKTNQASSSPSFKTAGLRTPVPPSYLELPPPPPYRPPSPLSPASPNNANSSNRSWYSSLFSVVPSPTPPSSSSSSTSTTVLSPSFRSGLPLYNTASMNMNNDSSSSNSSSNLDSSLSLNNSRMQNPRNNINSQQSTYMIPQQQQQQQYSSSNSQRQEYISHTRQSSLADNEDEERDSDNFSLHSVKARR